MLIYVAADLHYGHNAKGNASVEALARHVTANPVDVLLLVGDLACDRDSTIAVLKLFEDFEGQILAVPGNHDIWLPGWQGATTSWDIHDRFLVDVLQDANVHPLHISPIAIDDIGFVGSMGWYDYSFRDDIGIPIENYRTKTPPWSRWPIWMDARHARFFEDDETVTRTLTRRLRQQLATIEARQIVAMVHHVISKKLLVHPRERLPEKWRFANAFLGAEQLGDLLASDLRVKHAFCGHIHLPMHARKGALPCTTVGADYKNKQLLLTTPTQQVGDYWFHPTGHPAEG